MVIQSRSFSALLFCASSALILTACKPTGPSVVRFGGPIMGTRYTVKIARLPRELDLATVKAGVEKRLEAIDAAMSTYRPDSEVSRASRYDETDWFPVSEETAAVIETARRIGVLSGGALDITVAPLVNLWGFGPDKQREDVPGKAEITAALASVGSDKLEVRSDPPAVRKLHPRTQIDLSAVAKGFAVDEVARNLDSLGLESYMVDIGGELRTAGEKAPGVPWRIGIETPLELGREVAKLVPLRDQAMATSGDYRNFFMREGRRFSHTIDPRTGRPVTHALASVSVITSTCMEADALATALMVLGPEAGYQFAAEHNLAAFFIVRSSDGAFAERATPAMQELFGNR